MPHFLLPTLEPVLQQIRLLEVAKSSSVAESREKLYFLQQTRFMLRVLQAQSKLVLQQVM